MTDLLKIAVFAYLFYVALVFIPSLIAEEAPSLINYDKAERRDPFTPLIGPGGTILQGFNPNDLKVEGIIYDPNRGSLALINGEFYKRGDTLKDIIVTQIYKDRVVITKEGEEKILWIREDSEQQGEIKNETTSSTVSS